MKKNWLSLISLVLCALLLTGCGAVGEVEKSIEQIGTVSLESLTAIENAEALYAELAKGDQAKVENYAVLTAARETYNQMVLVQQTENSIANAKQAVQNGSLAWENYTKFEEMLSALNTLEEAGLFYKLAEEQRSDVELVTTAAVAGCGDRVLALFDNLQAQEALDLLLDLLERYPDREDVSALVPEVFTHCEVLADEHAYRNPQFVIDMIIGLDAAFPEQEFSEAMLGSCKSAYYSLTIDEERKGNYDGVIALWKQALSYIDSTYSLSKAYIAKFDAELAETGDKFAVLEQIAQVPGETVMEYSFRKYVDDLLDELYKEQRKTRPENCAVIGNNPHKGKFNLRLKSGLQDVCYKLTSVSDPSEYALFYVHGGNVKFTYLGLDSGSYKVTCAVGWLWDGKDALFGEDTMFYEFVDMPCEIVVHSTSAAAVPGYTMTRYSMSVEEYSTVTDEGRINPAMKEISASEF